MLAGSRPAFLGLLSQVRQVVGHKVGRLAGGVPAVAVAGGAPQSPVGMPAHPDGDVGLLHRLGGELNPVYLVKPAVILRVALSPEDLENLQELVAHGAPLVVGHSQGLKLLLQPAHSHAAYHCD